MIHTAMGIFGSRLRQYNYDSYRNGDVQLWDTTMIHTAMGMCSSRKRQYNHDSYCNRDVQL